MIVRFCLKLLLFLSIQAVPGALLLSVDAEGSGTDYVDAAFDKIRLLENEPSPRLIILAGSSAAFGFDSETLTDRTGLNVINLGLHGLIPIEWWMNETLPRLRPGDVVLLTPEYLAPVPWNAMLGRLIAARPSSVQQFPRRLLVPEEGVGKFLESFRETYGELWKVGALIMQRKLTALRSELRGSQTPQQGGGESYSRSSFNRRGDHVAHWDAAPQEILISPISPKVCDLIPVFNEFAAEVEQNGAICLFAFPPVLDELRRDLDEEFTSIETCLTAGLHVPIVGPKQVVGLGPELHFDTTFHLSKQGVDWRTDQTARVINQYLDPK